MNKFKSAIVVLFTIFVSYTTQVCAQTIPSAFTSGTRYDTSGSIVGVISPDPDGTGPIGFAATRNTYNAAGLLSKVETGELSVWLPDSVAPASWSNFTILQTVDISYDAFDRKIKTIKSSGDTIISVVQYSYDAVGRLECTALRMNPLSFASLPASACTLAAEGSQGPDRITKYIYDGAGNIVQIRKAVGTNLEQAEATYSYTGNGKQEYLIDANGNRSKLEYDGYDRLTKWIFPTADGARGYSPASQATALSSSSGVNASDYEQYGYDANGNRTLLRKRDGSSFIFDYDALNRMIVKTVPERAGLDAIHTRDVYYGYDLRGLQVYARFDSAAGEGVTNTYDGFGNRITTTNNMGGITRSLASAYDLNNNRYSITHPDDQQFSYTFDGLDRVTGVSDSATANNNLLSVVYQNNGKRKKITRNGSSGFTSYDYENGAQLKAFSQTFTTNSNNLTNSFLYNKADQVIQLTQSNSQYNYVGNEDRVGAYISNGLNQYKKIGATVLGYDTNGNLYYDGMTYYSYDNENRLVKSTRLDDASFLVEMSYDPNGRLFQVRSNTGGTRQFLYDGNALVAEYSGSTLVKRYVHGDQVDEPWVQYSGASVATSGRQYLHANHQGSIIAHSNSTGAVVNTLAYDAYGIPASMNVGAFAYTGQLWLPEIGLYYYKARVYSPKLGRFLQTDPIGYKDDMDLYTYVGNDPMNKTDPTGLEEKMINGIMYASREFVNPKDLKGHALFLNSEGKAECVELVKQTVGSNMSTSNWVAGEYVNKDTPVGTAIANFNKDGKFDTKDTGQHAALLVEPTRQDGSIKVADQWKSMKDEGKKVQVRPIEKVGRTTPTPSNNAKDYRVILFPKKEKE